MSYSAPQLIAISGFLQNQGLALSRTLIGRLNNLEDTITFTGKLHRLVGHPLIDADVRTAIRTKIPGFSLSAPITYSFLPTQLNPVDITGSIRTYAKIFYNRGVPGFLQIVNSASVACQTSRDVLGALHELETGGFAGVDPAFSSQTDLATGGLSSRFGPLAKGSQDYLKASGLFSGGSVITQSAADIKRSITAVADGISKLGTLYDFQNLEQLGTPAGLFKSLYKQGLVKINVLNLLAKEALSIDQVDSASPVVLTSILETITGTELDNIITVTGLKVPSSTVFLNGGDLVKSEKILAATAASAIPGGTIESLGKQLISLNLSYASVQDLTNAFYNVIVPDHPHLSALTQPVPAADVTVLRNKVASGGGDFNSCRIFDIIGTPSGFVHNDAMFEFERIGSLSEIAKATTLQATADALYAKYDAAQTATAEEVAFIAALTAFSDDLTIQPVIERTNTAISNIINQVRLEIANCSIVGLDLYSTLPGSGASLIGSSGLVSFGNDIYNIGIKEYFLAMVTDDKYGDAVKAVLLQGVNDNILNTVGISGVGIPTVSQTARKVSSAAGSGLTEQQRENVIAEARLRNADIDTALTNTAFYGYNSQYYQNLGYPAA